MTEASLFRESLVCWSKRELDFEITGQIFCNKESNKSVSFFYFEILSMTLISESFKSCMSFLFSCLSSLTFSIRFLSLSLISLDLSVDKFSIIELWLFCCIAQWTGCCTSVLLLMLLEPIWRSFEDTGCVKLNTWALPLPRGPWI